MPSFGGGPKTGHKMKLYRNTGTVATPVWLLVDEVGDVSIPDFSVSLAELKRRASKYTKNLPGLFNSIAVEFRLHFGLDKVNYDAIVAKFLAQLPEEWAVASGAIATIGTRYLRLPVFVEQWPWDQALEDVAGHDCRLAIAYMEDVAGVEVEPSWNEVIA